MVGFSSHRMDYCESRGYGGWFSWRLPPRPLSMSQRYGAGQLSTNIFALKKLNKRQFLPLQQPYSNKLQTWLYETYVKYVIKHIFTHSLSLLYFAELPRGFYNHKDSGARATFKSPGAFLIFIVKIHKNKYLHLSDVFPQGTRSAFYKLYVIEHHSKFTSIADFFAILHRKHRI